MKHSTGKPTRLRHSTGYDWDELEKMKARAGPYRYRKPRFEGEEHLEKFRSVLAEKMRKKLGK